MKSKKIFYTSFEEDVVVHGRQNVPLPEDYKWIDERRKTDGKLLYSLAKAAGWLYFKLFFGGKIVGKEKLKGMKDTGYFLYCNHTQPLGDVLFPALPATPKRIYIVVSPANLSLPVIGKMLPALGALPTASNIREQRQFGEAVKRRIEEKNCVVIYPEGHLWPWYTGIRPFAPGAFHYPVELGVPAFTMVTVYRKRKFVKKPAVTLYIDGPFYPDPANNKRAEKKALGERIRDRMTEAAHRSDICYYEYIRKEE